METTRKASILIVLAVFAAAAMLYSVSGANVLKWNICTGINATGGACDDLWEQLTGQVSGSSNANLSAYYNKSDIDTRLSDLAREINRSNNISIPPLNESRVTEIAKQQAENISDGKVREAVSSFDNRLGGYITRDEHDAKKSDFNPLWIVGIAAVVIVGLMFLSSQGAFKKKTQLPPSDFNQAMEAIKQMNRQRNTGAVEARPQRFEPQPDPSYHDQLKLDSEIAQLKKQKAELEAQLKAENVKYKRPEQSQQLDEAEEFDDEEQE